MFTVRRLRLSASLERTLTTTNPVQSAIFIARTTQRNVKRWKDAAMPRRRTAARNVAALADTPPRVSPKLFAVTA